MAVTRAGTGYTAAYILGGDTDGTKSFTFNVSTGSNTYGIVAYGFVGDTDISTAATFDVTWDGDPMEPLCDPLYFDEHSGHHHSTLRGWIIESPASGVAEVEVSYADVPAALITKNLFAAAVVLSSVEPLDLDTVADAVVTAEASTAVTTSGVSVPSGVPADRVISAHLIGKLRAFTGFSGTRVAAPILAGGGQLMIGESRGDTSTVCTATHNATSSNWAAFGLNLDALPLEGLGFTSTAAAPVGSFGADLYRFAQPHPDRDYLVPATGSGDVNLIAGVTLRNAGGVDMPVWQKDPDSLLEYTLRWNNHLAADDELIRVEHTPYGSLRIISELINPDDKAMTQFWTKSGTSGITHPVRVRLWTKKGRQDDFTCFIYCENN